MKIINKYMFCSTNGVSACFLLGLFDDTTIVFELIMLNNLSVLARNLLIYTLFLYFREARNMYKKPFRRRRRRLLRIGFGKFAIYLYH